MHPMVQYALRAARSAGEQFLRIRERIENAREEHNLERLLEEAARNAETLIVRQLSRGYPQHGIVGRFTPQRDGEGDGHDVLWHIEPIHGYANLSVASPGFAVSVVCTIKGRVEHAVVICPFSDDEYLASRGAGVQLNGKRLRVRATTAIEGSRVAMGLPVSWLRSRCLPDYLKLTELLAPQVEQFRASGSGLLDMLELASGRADSVLVAGLEEQDLLVGSLMMKEAGALVSAFDGQPRVVPEGGLMAASPRLYKLMLRQIQPHFS